MNENRKLFVETFFKEYKDLFKGSGVDRWLNTPEGTTQKFFKYNINYNRNRTNRAYREIIKMGEFIEKLKHKHS